MKDCPSCKVKCENSAETCSECGHHFTSSVSPTSKGSSTMFGIPGIELGLTPEESEKKADVKNTLFGLPAQKIQDLLAEEENKRSAKDAPLETASTQTMAGFKIEELFGSEEPSPKPIERKPAPPEETPKFGTMLGINVADIINYGEEMRSKKESVSSKTLFSSPAVFGTPPEKLDSLRDSRSGDTAGYPRAAGETASSGLPAATQNRLPEEGSKPKLSKVTLPSMLQKPLSRSKVKPIPKREPISTPVEFGEEFGEKEISESKSASIHNASGIVKRAKPSKRKREASGVVGAYVVSKEQLSSDEIETTVQSSHSNPNTRPTVERPSLSLAEIEELGNSDTETPSFLLDSELFSEASDPILKKADSEAFAPERDDLLTPAIEEQKGVLQHQIEVEVEEKVPPTLSDESSFTPQNSESVFEEPIQKEIAVVPPKPSSRPDPTSATSKLVHKIQIGFVVLGMVLNFVTATMLIMSQSLSLPAWGAIGFSFLSLIAAAGGLFTSDKNTKMMVLGFAGIICFVISAVVAAVISPLGLLFAFAGLLFMSAALFPFVVTKL